MVMGITIMANLLLIPHFAGRRPGARHEARPGGILAVTAFVQLKKRSPRKTLRNYEAGPEFLEHLHRESVEQFELPWEG